MSIRMRLLLAFALPLLGLMALGWFEISVQWQRSADMQRMSGPLRIAQAIAALVHETQKERGMSAGFLGSNGAQFASELPEQYDRTDRRIDELEALLGELQSVSLFGMTGPVDAALARLDQALRLRPQVRDLRIEVARVVEDYTSANAALLDQVSGLPRQIPDDRLVRDFSAYSAVQLAKERAGIERALAANAFGRGDFAPRMAGRYQALVSAQQLYLDRAGLISTHKVRERLASMRAAQPFARVQAIRNAALENRFDRAADEVFQTYTAKIDLYARETASLFNDLRAAVVRAQESARDRLVWTAVGVLVITLLALAAMLLAIARIQRSLGLMQRQAEELSQGDGDLTRRLDVPSGDELGNVARSIEGFIDSLDQRMLQVQCGLSSSGDAMLHVLRQLGTVRIEAESTARIGEEVAAATHEMSASVQEITANVAQAANASQEAVQIAQQGGQAMRATMEQTDALGLSIRELAEDIARLEDSARNISTVVTVINDISEQTNLLALNAAIEAARAGEAGKGFAVVADEVRKLAEKTQDSTQEIEKAIGGIVSRVEESSRAAGQAAEQMQEQSHANTQGYERFEDIQQGIRHLDDMLSGVSAALEEQSAVTTQLAANSEQVSQSSELSRDQVLGLSHDIETLLKAFERIESVFGGFTTSNSGARFVRAKIAHVMFVQRVEAAAVAQRAVELPTDRTCAFGQFMYGPEAASWRDDSRFRRLEAPHKAVHEAGNDLMRVIGDGDLEGIKRARTHLHEASEQFVRIVDELTGCRTGDNGLRALE